MNKNNNWKALILASYTILVSGCAYAIKNDQNKQKIINVQSSIEEVIPTPEITPIINEVIIESSSPTEEPIEILPEKSNQVIAKEVIDGLWGDGEERIQKLTEAGYNYQDISTIVNNLLAGKEPEEPNYIYSGIFAYLNQDSNIYDENGNSIYYANTYEKTIIIDDNNNDLKHVVINGTENGSIEGYVDNNCLTILPNTYVEVDISEQKLYMYYNDELVLEANVITGGPDKGATPGTNVGFTNVISKQYQVELSGPTWSDAYVDIFIKFNWCGEGFHDADAWRDDSEYTQDHYLTNGSHGCVNMKQNDAETLDKYTEVGTPVLVHK